MSNTAVLERVIRDAQEVLWDNLRPTDNLPDEPTVMALRAIVSAPRVDTALEQASDTVFVFVLRAVRHILSDQWSAPRETIYQLWDVLDEPELNALLGFAQNSQIRIGPRKPQAG